MSLYLGDTLISGAEQFVGESRNIGQIIPSTIPLQDAGLHLLDGALIQGSGIYNAFVDYIASLYGEPETFVQPWLTSNGTLGGDSYAVWTDVTQYPEIWAGAWGLFNDNGLFHSAQGSTTGNIIFYSPKPLNLTNITFHNQIVAGSDVSNRASSAGNIYGSNDGTNWTLITTYTNSVQGQEAWSVSLSSNTTYYKYYKINSTANGGSDYWCIQGLTLTGTHYNCPDYFCTEAEWQSAVTTYGACDKYVYDSVNNTVRLPKRSTTHGKLISSYNGGTIWYRVYEDGWCEQGGGLTTTGTVTFLKPFINTNITLTMTRNSAYQGAISAGFHGSWTSAPTTTGFTCFYDSNTAYSWSASGYIDISDYQYSPIYEYIVLATSTKTEIEVDIDEIATDLNGKADVDLSNVNNTAKTFCATASLPSSTYQDLTLGASGTGYTAPADGWVQLKKMCGASGQYFYLINDTAGMYCMLDNIANGYEVGGYIPVRKGDSFQVLYNLSGNTNWFRFIYAEGSKWEAS